MVVYLNIINYIIIRQLFFSFLFICCVSLITYMQRMNKISAICQFLNIIFTVITVELFQHMLCTLHWNLNTSNYSVLQNDFEYPVSYNTHIFNFDYSKPQWLKQNLPPGLWIIELLLYLTKACKTLCLKGEN